MRSLLVFSVTLSALLSSAAAQPAAVEYTCALKSGNGPFETTVFRVEGTTLQGRARWAAGSLEKGEIAYLARRHGGQAGGGGVYMSGDDQTPYIPAAKLQLAVSGRLGHTSLAIGHVSAKVQNTGLYRCRARPYGRPVTNSNR